MSKHEDPDAIQIVPPTIETVLKLKARIDELEATIRKIQKDSELIHYREATAIVQRLLAGDDVQTVCECWPGRELFIEHVADGIATDTDTALKKGG